VLAHAPSRYDGQLARGVRHRGALGGAPGTVAERNPVSAGTSLNGSYVIF